MIIWVLNHDELYLAHEHERRSNQDGGTSELTHVFEVYDLFAVKTRTLQLMVTWLTRSTF